MILKYMNKPIRFNALRSLKQTADWSLNKSLFHTTAFSQDDENKNNAAAKNEAEMSKTAAERRKQMLKAKFGKMDFIALENKPTTSASTPQVKQLKPNIDYQRLVKPNAKKGGEKPEKDNNKSIDNLEKQQSKSIKEETALKVATLIDPIKPEEEMRNLLEPMTKIKNKLERKKNQEFKNISKPKEFKNHLRSLLDEVKRNEVKISKVEKTLDAGEDSSKKLVLHEDDFKYIKPEKPTQFRGSPYQTFHSLKGGNGLAIFTDIKQRTSSTTSTQESVIWSMHQEEELKSAQEIPHLNGFEEMIKLTEEGKLWKFPIDNEQGIEEFEDAQTPFHEHIFLDHHLERFPDIEPIQQFMTLAINGLSKNGFISLKEKLEIIDWYHDYFAGKLDLINEALSAEQKEREFKEALRKGVTS